MPRSLSASSILQKFPSTQRLRGESGIPAAFVESDVRGVFSDQVICVSTAGGVACSSVLGTAPPDASPGQVNTFNRDLLTIDEHCYECKVKYRDPKPSDLVMYLHALKYSVSLTPQDVT